MLKETNPLNHTARQPTAFHPDIQQVLSLQLTKVTLVCLVYYIVLLRANQISTELQRTSQIMVNQFPQGQERGNFRCMF